MELFSSEIYVRLRISGVQVVILVNKGKIVRSTGNVIYNILECSYCFAFKNLLSDAEQLLPLNSRDNYITHGDTSNEQ